MHIEGSLKLKHKKPKDFLQMNDVTWLVQKCTSVFFTTIIMIHANPKIPPALMV